MTFRGYKIGRVHQEPEHATLEPRRSGEEVQVVVPKLSIHTMVVAELE